MRLTLIIRLKLLKSYLTSSIVIIATKGKNLLIGKLNLTIN